ncbi:unnamed protein product [Rhizophagus irregularis]|nr:unnamed protein product [Rhizophagus irregularis]CAB5193505.1 unnamed protein product [Rhizophagus irregularis]
MHEGQNRELAIVDQSRLILGQTLERRKPHLYWSFKCPMCNMEEENIIHVNECKGESALAIKKIISLSSGHSSKSCYTMT